MGEISQIMTLILKMYFLYQNFSISGKIFKITLSKNVKIPNDQDGSYLFFFFNCTELCRYSFPVSHPECFSWNDFSSSEFSFFEIKQSLILFPNLQPTFPMIVSKLFWFYFVSSVANLEKYNGKQIRKKTYKSKITPFYNFVINLHLKSQIDFLKYF